MGTAEFEGPVTSFRFTDSLEGLADLNGAIPLRFKFVAMKGKRCGGLGLGGVQASLPPCMIVQMAPVLPALMCGSTWRVTNQGFSPSLGVQDFC